MMGVERRAQILEAAGQVFARRGFRGATTREIAREAGVTEGTLFRCFPTKRHLSLALLETLTLQPIRRHPEALNTIPPARWLEAFLQERLIAMRQHLPLMQALYQETRTDEAIRRAFLEGTAQPFLEQVRGMLTRELDQGGHRDLHPGLVMWVLWGALHSVTVFGMELDPELAAMPPEQVARQLAALLLHGLRLEARRGPTGAG